MNADGGSRVAVVTGAATGIGLAISRAFAQDGYSIALLDIRETALKQAVADRAFAKVRVAPIVCDVAKSECCDAAIKETLRLLGKIDVLVNNAGIGAHAPLDQVSVEDIDSVLAVNTRGPILLSRAVLPHMIERGSGAIINISSTAGKMGLADLAPYSASKMAILGLTRSLAVELAPKGIRVNAICPGVTNTPMMEKNIRTRMKEKNLSYEVALNEFVSNVPTKRMVEPEDIADAAVFLASDRARRITGEDLNVADGATMW